jgi:pimeloyl-ACP methyl ester carboxylesterase
MWTLTATVSGRVTLTSEETGKRYEWLVKGYDFYDLVFTSLYVTQLIGYLPAIISLTYEENYQLLEILGSVFILDFSIDYGVYYSVQCAEEVPFQKPEEVEAAVARLDVRYRQFAEAQPYDIFRTCAIWDVTPSAAIEEMPISSDIPTLVVAGQFDPITPPAYGQAAAATLSHSYFFEYPGRGHGVFDEGDCPLSIALAFLEDPTTAPDGSCIDEMRVEFLIP